MSQSGRGATGSRLSCCALTMCSNHRDLLWLHNRHSGVPQKDRLRIASAFRLKGCEIIVSSLLGGSTFGLPAPLSPGEPALQEISKSAGAGDFGDADRAERPEKYGAPGGI